MKLGSYIAIKNCIFNNMTVELKSEKTGFHYKMWINNGLIVVDKLNSGSGIEFFSSFRNGNEEQPDIEGFLDGWVETVNSVDCIVDIY